MGETIIITVRNHYNLSLVLNVNINISYLCIIWCFTMTKIMIYLCNDKIWAASWQNKQNGICAQRRLRSARSVWSESSLSTWRKLGSSATHWAHSEDSDQTGRMPQADLSLRWAHTPFRWFCHEAAHIIYLMKCTAVTVTRIFLGLSPIIYPFYCRPAQSEMHPGFAEDSGFLIYHLLF